MKFLAFIFLSLHLAAGHLVIVTATLGDSYAKATLSGVYSKYLYCKNHGYDLFVLTENLDPSRPLAWNKIKIVEQLLKEYDYVFWSDADSIFMNQALSLDSLIDMNAPQDFHICFDNFSRVVNSGQFLIRKSDRSLEFLQDTYDCTYAINHPWWENRAIIDLLESKYSTGFAKIYPQRTFNSFGNSDFLKNKSIAYQPGDFIVHFPSTSKQKLARLMATYGAYFLKHPVNIPKNQIIKFEQ